MTPYPMARGTPSHLRWRSVALAAGGTGFILGLLQPLIAVGIGVGVFAGPSVVGLAFLLCLIALPMAAFVAISPPWRRAATVVAIASSMAMAGMVAGNAVAGAAHISWARPRVASTPEPPTGAAWTAAGRMHTARYDHTATLLPDGRVLVAGGKGADERAMASAEIFDPKTAQWSDTGSMLMAHADHTAISLHDGRVLVLGHGDGGAEVFDPDTGSWSAVASPAQRNSAPVALLGDGRVLLTGGLGSTGSATGSAELFDPTTGSWTTTAPMITPRSQHSATLLPDGRVLVAGGVGNETPTSNPMGLLTAAELYDPVTDSWTATGEMVARTADHAAVVLDDGRVLATSIFECCQVYFPDTGRWGRLGESFSGGSTGLLLPDGRVLLVGLFSEIHPWDPRTPRVDQPAIEARHASGATATLLNDGRVLFVGGTVLGSSGGYAINSTVLASADLYDPTVHAP